MSMMKEFKEFAVKGSMVDMAVGIVIGGAFGAIVKSLVADVIMPPLGKLTGGVDFTNLLMALDGGVYDSLAAAREAGAPVVAYGNFLQQCVDFLIVAFAIFLVVKAINRLRREEKPVEEAPAAPPEDIVLLREIRDSLKTQS